MATLRKGVRLCCLFALTTPFRTTKALRGENSRTLQTDETKEMIKVVMQFPVCSISTYIVRVQLLKIEVVVDAPHGNHALDDGYDSERQQEQGTPHRVEQGQGDEGRLRVQDVVHGIDQDERGERCQRHHEGGRRPGEELRGLQELEDLELLHLLLPQLVDPLDKAQLPTVELDNLDTVQDLGDETHPLVLLFHLTILVLFHNRPNDCV